MRLVVDMSPVRLTGPRVYCEGFLTALVRLLEPGDQLTVFGPDDIENIVGPLTGANVRFIGDALFKRVPARLWWQQLSLPRLLTQLKADVLFAPFDVGPWRGRCPMVVGIRNPNPIVLSGEIIPLTWRRRTLGPLHIALVARTCRRAKLMIFPSRFAADAVGAKLPGRPEDRRVVHHGLDTEFWADSAAETGPRGKYILFASKFYIQKRAPLLLEAFAAWRQRYGREDYRLVYCGEEPGSPQAQPVLRRIAELGLGGSVDFLGIVSRPELRRLCRSAAAIVMPTILETFGFPYVEAMAVNTPLVCADIEVARELCGDAAWYFRPDDRDSLADALERPIADDAGRAAKLALGIERAKRFSWQKEATETLACLREAMSA